MRPWIAFWAMDCDVTVLGVVLREMAGPMSRLQQTGEKAENQSGEQEQGDIGRVKLGQSAL